MNKVVMPEIPEYVGPILPTKPGTKPTPFIDIYSGCIYSFEGMVEKLYDMFQANPLLKTVYPDMWKFLLSDEDNLDAFTFKDDQGDTLDGFNITCAIQNPNYETELRKWKEEQDQYESNMIQYEKDLAKWIQNELAWDKYRDYLKSTSDSQIENIETQISDLQKKLNEIRKARGDNNEET
jgi:hypothetical protein